MERGDPLGLFEKLIPKKYREKNINEYFQALTAYTPVFRTYMGGLYEMELTRSAIHCIATHCSKLKPEIQGSAYKNLEKVLQYQPNPYMDTTKFLYRLATILYVNTTAFILPLYDDDMLTIKGFYPLLPNNAEIVEYGGEPYLRYTFSTGKRAAIELSKVGILTQYQYKSDFFGDGNDAMNPTLKLLDIQKQGMENAVKSSAMIRFLVRLAQTLRPTDITEERNRFTKENLSADNTSGVLMVDSKYADVQQIDSKPYLIDHEQMKLIQTNVYNYFGVNEKILQNSYTEDEWNAFYEGKIEPFAIQLSLVLTNMLFSEREKSTGNLVILSSNRLQYMSNQSKLNVSTQLFDRGILTTNQIMDIWNLPHVEDGDKRYIRKEYTEVSQLDKENNAGGDNNGSQDTGQGVQSDSSTVPNSGDDDGQKN